MSEELGADARNVFVVYGRNSELRRAMFEFLRSIGLNPIEWSMAVAMTETGAPYLGEIPYSSKICLSSRVHWSG